jgi:hypothetical protein
MRRSSGVNRGFAGGQISKGAMNRRGFDFGTTSDNPVPLRRDDGGNGRNPVINGRRQPSRGGTSRMNREVQVRTVRGSG